MDSVNTKRLKNPVDTLGVKLAGQSDVTKLSYHAYAYCIDRYVLLDAGSALGRNCGPLLISNRAIAQDEVAGQKVARALGQRGSRLGHGTILLVRSARRGHLIAAMNAGPSISC